jgi:DNA replication and repair protein RecF
MLLEKLTLHNFRNYEEGSFTFAPGVNLIYGENGVGKTSILEAIYLLSTGRSFRAPSLETLIRKGCPHFLIQAHFRKDERLYKVNFFYSSKERKITCQGTPLKRYAELLGMFPSVLYSTLDHQMIMGAPSERRRFLNMTLGQTDPLYVEHLIRFTRCLKQRNSLLKSGSVHQLTPFDPILAQSGSYLMQKRESLTAYLKQRVKEHSKTLKEPLEAYSLKYSSSCPLDGENTEKLLLEQLKKDLEKDRLFGSTSSGPHRDDLLLLFNKKPAKQYASEGQKRTLLSAMKLAEYDFIQEKFGASPLLGIDDFTVHLDERRIEALEKSLSGNSQVFLTAPSDSQLAAHRIFLSHDSTNQKPLAASS